MLGKINQLILTLMKSASAAINRRALLPQANVMPTALGPTGHVLASLGLAHAMEQHCSPQGLPRLVSTAYRRFAHSQQARMSIHPRDRRGSCQKKLIYKKPARLCPVFVNGGPPAPWTTPLRHNLMEDDSREAVSW